MKRRPREIGSGEIGSSIRGRAHGFAWGLVACSAAVGGCSGAGADGDASRDAAGRGSGPASTAGAPPASASASASPGGGPDRSGHVADAPWTDVERWIAQHEICWAAPIANGRAFVTKCGGTEHRTTLPRPDSLKKAVDAADPKHDTIAYTTHYEAFREVAWPAAAALFPTGTVYEVEVNQNLRAFLTTSGGGTINARYATVVGSDEELARLAKDAPRPLVVKLFRVEELPWKRALEVFASGRVAHAGRVHIGRVFMTDRDGRDYLTIPPSDDALRQVEAIAPNVPWTVE